MCGSAFERAAASKVAGALAERYPRGPEHASARGETAATSSGFGKCTRHGGEAYTVLLGILATQNLSDVKEL